MVTDIPYIRMKKPGFIDPGWKEQIMKKKYAIFIGIILLIAIIHFIFNTSINKHNSYYIARIESIDKKDGITTVNVSPMKNNRKFVSEIKANHKLEYTDDIMISGIRERCKKRKRVHLRQLGESIHNLKVGDSIIFKVKHYNKNDYNLEIEELAVDLTF